MVGFNDKKVAKVTTPVGTEAVSLFTDVSAASTWALNRGPQGIMFDNNEFYVTGDNGTDGFIGVYNAAGVEQRKANLAGTRIITAASLDSDSLVAGKSNSSTLITIKKSDLTNELVDSVAPSTGWGAPVRKIQVDSAGVIYYAMSTNSAVAPTGHKLGKAIPGATPGNLAQYTFVQWYGPDLSRLSPGSIGIAPFSRGAESWMLFVNTGSTTAPPAANNPSIQFVNTATGVSDLSFEDTTNFNGGIRGIVTANIGGTDYMFVANSASPDALAPNQVHVYSLGASSVADWSIY